GVSNLAFAQRDEGFYLFHDEINIYGPVSRMGFVTDQNGQALQGLSNMVVEGFTFGIGVMEEDTMVCTVSPSGTYSVSKVVSLKGSSTSVPTPGLMDTLFEYLPGGSDEVKLRILAGSVLLFIVFLGAVIIMVRRSHSELEELEAALESENDTVELMVTPEEDHGPLLSVDDDEEVLTIQESSPVVLLEDEEESLADELEKKLEEGEGNARLERRMKRKQQREMAAILQQGLPPLPLPGSQPVPAIEPNAPAPLPLPDLKREATCPSCQATFSIKDLMLKRTTCPVCQEKFDL
ncbi:MAG: hypothetical protein QF531_01425, partial [Candidatus Poseidonia sp.]|nr:hypothetical protein [Poseidonia sp.]